MTKAEQAIAMHTGGSSCSQAVFSVFAADLGLDMATAHKLSTGLGGGMGRMGLTCGAISGGVLALSLRYGNPDATDQAAKMDTYERCSAFIQAMQNKFGATECRMLLNGADLWTEEGRAKVVEQNLADKVCNAMIAEAVNYLESVLHTEHN